MTHLNDGQLIERLYGVAAHPHADSCPECAARYAEMERRRAEAVRPAAVSAEFLAKQHEAVLLRVDRPRLRLAWIPALAATAAVAIGFFVYRPAPAPRVEAGDEQLFADVYSMAQSTEPSAASPIHSLFEDNQ